jgi:hypothetical protein
MRTLSLTLVIGLALVACSGSPGSPQTGGQTPGSNAPVAGSPDVGASSGTATGSSPASGAPSGATSNGAALPASCAQGFAKYLTQIEPIVSAFDPAKATLGALSTAKQSVQEKSVELLMANNATAPYSCSEVGLEWAYFDSKTPWDAVLAAAAEAAPKTVGYLTAIRDEAAIDVAKVADYGVEGCDAAVASIKQKIAAEVKAGKSTAAKMILKDGLALLGLYRAYMADVGNGVCPADELGNDEFGFFGALG